MGKINDLTSFHYLYPNCSRIKFNELKDKDLITVDFEIILTVFFFHKLVRKIFIPIKFLENWLFFGPFAFTKPLY
ncbi:hypothetical protein BpHYR1_013510 [Brachionus plicatilis]|uniref:Uncharacterized protein n=1 Tax=Brachionus plicatilis TaxID=10195 RepID=A0A3M7SSU3_BRAPC|nr:hypothetical protein BpHYR1_013510 [Brachionus plicatilis]